MAKTPKLFPEPIINLPEADIPLDGVTAYLSQGNDHQIIFMEFDKDVELPEHAHESQWGIVLEGTCRYHLLRTEG